MSKGPSQTGTRTTTAIDPLRQAQAPFLAGGWQSALDLLQQAPQTPYQGPTYAMPTPEQYQGYGNLYNAGVNAQGLNQAAYNPFYAATGGQYGVQNSPAYGGLQQIAGGTSPEMQQAAQNAAQMVQYGTQGYGVGNQANTNLYGIGSTAAGAGTNYGNALQGIGNNALGLGGGYGSMLVNQAGGIPGVVAPSRQQLGYNAATANTGNPAAGMLTQQASGQYLDPSTNPYLAGTFVNAADAVRRGYQTTTAPRTESSYEGAGRYGSPSLRNAVGQNEQNLGLTLNKLATDIYGGQYGAERQLQNAATSTLGSQYLQGLGQSSQAAQAAGQLGLGAAEAQQRGYGAAANAALQGAQQQGQNYGTAANAALQGLQQQGQNTYQGGGLALSGANQAIDALARSGALGLQNTQAMQSALGALQGGYQQGNAQALSGAGLAPQLIQANITGANAQTQAGAGLQGLTQAQYDDAQRRYIAQQASPWDNLNNYMKLIGNPTGASSISQQPIYGSPAAQTLGLLGGVNNLLGGSGAGGGGGGFLGGLGGSGSYGGIGADYGGGGELGVAGSAFAPALAAGAGAAGGGGSILGTLGSLAMNFLPLILSDRRLKEDTRVVGNLGSLPLHSFRYRGDPTRRIGFMADEVERVDPGAVVDTSLGFKAVNYGRAAASALAGA